ncbi:DNA cytosine methyltransferase [Alteromonas gilva]|uniref:DNA (cytosine-5-)-methyltransferase n=1 Tax=Alteromonas gilva TaxID=2987522 RepID=A0ABT5L6Y0_9ALTE|nr:DNA cytosine methyltransferase [Alteromonas gilva]MDC8832800.1 DNA cytosine methyltransferase [Alteromonas gilva]
MHHIETLSLKETAKGKRVFLNNASLVRSGFVAGAKYSANYKKNFVELTLSTEGTRTVADTFKGPIIDLQNKGMTNAFPKASRVHVDYLPQGKIRIRAYHHDSKVAARENALLSKLKSGSPLRIGEQFAGFGLLARQIKRGLKSQGIKTSLCFAGDTDRFASDTHAHNNEMWSSKTDDAILLNDDLFTMDMSLVPQMDMLIMGYPCTPFSQQQSAKRKKDTAHDLAGLLFVPVLELINRANPALILVENSHRFEGSDTDNIISTVLERTGYKSTSTTIKGTEHGGFEIRPRIAKLFYSANLCDIDLSQLTGSKTNLRTVSDILEPIADDSPAWKDLGYIRVKNTEKHHSHRFCEVKPTDTVLPTFGANYGKIQPDSAMVAHPSNPDLHRIFSTAEHCNVRDVDGPLKQIIVDLAEGRHHLCQGSRTNAVRAHRILGNSVSPESWDATGSFIGNWMNGLIGKSTSMPSAKPIIGQLDLFSLEAA